MGLLMTPQTSSFRSEVRVSPKTWLFSVSLTDKRWLHLLSISTLSSAQCILTKIRIEDSSRQRHQRRTNRLTDKVRTTSDLPLLLSSLRESNKDSETSITTDSVSSMMSHHSSLQMMVTVLSTSSVEDSEMTSRTASSDAESVTL